jgi:ABC-type branched-subunit amino acid transport system substrate-binding protein
MGHSRATRGRTRGRRRWIVATACAALLAAACGTSDAPKATPTAVAAVATTRVPTVTPCGPGNASPSSEIGVTPEAITVGVVADVSGARALFRTNWEAMQAFAAYCNDAGGIAGRELRVQLFDTQVFRHRQAMIDSCTSVFALVGSAAAFDGDGASIEADCGIPDVAALVAQPAHERVPTVITPMPNPQRLYLVGPLRYLARLDPSAVRRAAMAYLDVGVTAVRAARQVEASRAVGYRFRSIAPIPAITGQGDLDGIAEQVVDRKAEYLSVQGSVGDLAGVQIALAARGYRPKLVDATSPLFYDPRYLRAVGDAGEGTYVLTTTTPFEDADRVPELERYVDWLQRTVPGAEPTAQGVRSWSAGLLFAEAARRSTPDLDRATLLNRLRGIHAWDGNGIQIRTDPGSGRASSCFAYVRVESGEFRRAYPAKGFACPSDGWLRLRRDFTHL